MVTCETKSNPESTPLIERTQQNHEFKQKTSTAECQLQERRDKVREIPSRKNTIINLTKLSYLKQSKAEEKN